MSRISLLITSWNTDVVLLNRLLETVVGFDEILLHIDIDNRPDNLHELKLPYNVRLIESDKHLTITEADTLLVKEAKGDWVSFMCDDDYFDKDGIFQLIKWVKNNDIRGDVIHFLDGFGGGMTEFNLGQIESNNGIPYCSFIRKKVLDDLGFVFKGDVAQDWELWIRLKRLGHKFVYLPFRVNYFERQPNSESDKQLMEHGGVGGVQTKVLENAYKD